MILDKKHYTPAERRFGRMLQEAHIPFKTKIKIESREVDFIVGRYAIDIDGHDQDPSKNELLVRNGYIPLHINNNEVSKTLINKLNVN